MTCWTCKHYDLGAVTNAGGRVMKNWAGRCLWDWPDLSLLISVTRGHSFKLERPAFMEPNDGVGYLALEVRQ